MYVSWKNGTEIIYHLNDAGYVIPSSICQYGANACDYKTVVMDATGGFSGTYEPPSNFEFHILDNSMTICGNWYEDKDDPSGYRWEPDLDEMKDLKEC
jgi:hypothetical protein